MSTTKTCERCGKFAVLTKGIQAVSDLISESEGVSGLHRNGDIALWSDLTEGGYFEAWLIEFSKAEAIITNTRAAEAEKETK